MKACLVFGLNHTLFAPEKPGVHYTAGSKAHFQAHIQDLQRYATQQGIDLIITTLSVQQEACDLVHAFYQDNAALLAHTSIANEPATLSYNHQTYFLSEEGMRSKRSLKTDQIPLVNLIHHNARRVEQGPAYTSKSQAIKDYLAPQLGLPLEHIVLIDDQKRHLQPARTLGIQTIDASSLLQSPSSQLPPCLKDTDCLAAQFSQVMQQTRQALNRLAHSQRKTSTAFFSLWQSATPPASASPGRNLTLENTLN